MGYKAFEHGFKCRGFQYEENKVFETEKAKMCAEGFHYCDNPLNTLIYKDLVDDNGNIAEFAEVEPLEEPLVENNACCTRKIKIGAKLKLGDFIKSSVEFLLNKVKNKDHQDYSNFASSKHRLQLASNEDYSVLALSGNVPELVSSGGYSCLALSGYGQQLVSNGYGANLASSGAYSQILSSGDYSELASSGYHSQLISSGYGSQVVSSGGKLQLVSSGNYSRLASSGHYSRLVSSGNCSTLISSGYGSQLVSSGDKCVVVNIGRDGRAKAKKGNFIVLAEYGIDNIPINIKATKVDGKIIKEDTWYRLVNGEFKDASDFKPKMRCRV